MTTFYLGTDPSKGYADFCFTNEHGSILPGGGRRDDTPQGHADLRRAITALLARDPKAQLLVGVEASGGLERNWLRTLRELASEVPAPECSAGCRSRLRLYHLNPLAVYKYLERELHRNVTDPISARGIADYLQRGLRRADCLHEPKLEGVRSLYRFTLGYLDHSVVLQNQLHALLPSVHPDLVQYCRADWPKWLLLLLVRYPSALFLSRAHTRSLARIGYITKDRATMLVEAAKTSVGSLRDDAGAAQTVQLLAKEILRLQGQVAALKQQLTRQFTQDREVVLSSSISGIGAWTAVCLRLECGSLTRFHSAEALIAQVGLDPRTYVSGDGEEHHGISHRGEARVRAALYMAALTAVRTNPVIRAYYTHLRAQGKPHLVALVACMAKLLRIAYACVMRDAPFDPEYQAQARKRWEAEEAARAARRNTPAGAPGPAALDAPVPEDRSKQPCGSLAAPISAREARRRRGAQQPPGATGPAGHKKGSVMPQAGFPGENVVLALPERHDIRPPGVGATAHTRGKKRG